MKLYRYMSFEYLRETVMGVGFAAQYASRFDDAFEGVAGIRIDGIQIPAQFPQVRFVSTKACCVLIRPTNRFCS